MSKYSETHAIIQNCYETLRSITKTEPTTVQVFRGLEEKYSYSTIYHHLRYIKVKFEQTQKISNIVDTRLIKTTYTNNCWLKVCSLLTIKLPTSCIRSTALKQLAKWCRF